MTWAKFTLVIGLTIALLAMQTPRFTARMAEPGESDARSALTANLVRTFGFRRVLRTAAPSHYRTAGDRADQEARPEGLIGPFFSHTFPDAI